MSQTKTLAARQAELQDLMATPAGRDRLEQIADGYRQDRGWQGPGQTSVISFIIVHERQLGLIKD